MAGCGWVGIDALVSVPGIYPPDGIFAGSNLYIYGCRGVQIYEVAMARLGQTITIVN